MSMPSEVKAVAKYLCSVANKIDDSFYIKKYCWSNGVKSLVITSGKIENHHMLHVFESLQAKYYKYDCSPVPDGYHSWIDLDMTSEESIQIIVRGYLAKNLGITTSRTVL